MWVVPTGFAIASLMLMGCASVRREPAKPETPVLVGELEREAIETALPRWVEAQESVELDLRAAEALKDVAEGAEVAVFLGTWCGDSRRELSRFWRALDEIGGVVPFGIEYIGVDRDKVEPAERTAGREILYVPTFIVMRGGEELGRIIESSPSGVETDLGDLLRGDQSGIVSGREEFARDEPDPDAP